MNPNHEKQEITRVEANRVTSVPGFLSPINSTRAMKRDVRRPRRRFRKRTLRPLLVIDAWPEDRLNHSVAIPMDASSSNFDESSEISWTEPGIEALCHLAITSPRRLDTVAVYTVAVDFMTHETIAIETN